MKLWKKTGIVLLLITTVLLLCACGKTKDAKKKDDSKETELILPDEKENGSDTETGRETEPVTDTAGSTAAEQTGQSEYVETDQVTEDSTGNRTEGNADGDTADISQEDSGEITLPYVPFS